MENNVPQRPYTRKEPDIIIKLTDIASYILWGLLFVNFAIIMMARPQGETFFDRLLSISVRNYWDAALLQIALFLSLAQLAISIISLYLNLKRIKRKDDRIRVSILISIFAALFVCLFLTIFLFFS